MNVGSALSYPVPAPAVKRPDVSKSGTDNDGETEAPRSAASSAQFAAFLSMIVANNPKVRSDLLKQLPADGAGLLDHLLMEGGVLTEGAESASEGTKALFAGSTGVAQLPNSAAMAAALQSSALDAARYGMMTDSARASANAAPVTTTDASAALNTEASVDAVVMPAGNKVAAPVKSSKIVVTRAEINAAFLAEARSVIASLQSGTSVDDDKNDKLNGTSSTTAPNRISQAVLSRIASKKGVSVEELMAIGDTEGAQAKQGLDALLAKAGTPEGLSIAAINAASTALASALAASASDPTTPIKDVSALDPELQARLARVTERMKAEFGHDVTVVETARSQERQDVLYEQGRSTPGAVVTWTKDSLHTQGEAADVIVDGSWNNAKGFARLQQIAKEEGLHTIPNDPGHLELPRDSWSSNADVRVQSMTARAPIATASGVARVATVANVAQVASTVSAGAPTAPALPQPSTPLDASLGLASQRNSNSSSDNSPSTDTSSEQPSKKSSTKAADKVNARPTATTLGDEPSTTQSKFIGPVDETRHSAETKSVNGTDRIQQIDSLREQQGNRPLSQITLEVDGPDGTMQQIKVGVNGRTVDTHISADSTSADRMRAHVGELRTGLESRGLEADSVRISTQGVRTADATEGVKPNAGIERDAMRLQSAGNAGTTGDPSAQQGPRDRSSAARDWEDKQAARDEQRAQNRDAQGRGSGNQDRQRPQYQEKK